MGWTFFIVPTAKNIVISTNFLVWKFCGKAQFPQFRANCPKPNFLVWKFVERHSFRIVSGELQNFWWWSTFLFTLYIFKKRMLLRQGSATTIKCSRHFSKHVHLNQKLKLFFIQVARSLMNQIYYAVSKKQILTVSKTTLIRTTTFWLISSSVSLTNMLLWKRNL